MENIAALLDQSLKSAGVPIMGVSIGKTDDASTWQIQFAPEATKADRQRGIAFLSTFNPNDYLVSAKEQAIDRQMQAPLIQAMLKAFAPALGKTTEEATALLKLELSRG